ncbi:hypothetical protein KCU61_g266, partial [Aureobasidium melanogenum]
LAAEGRFRIQGRFPCLRSLFRDRRRDQSWRSGCELRANDNFGSALRLQMVVLLFRFGIEAVNHDVLWLEVCIYQTGSMYVAQTNEYIFGDSLDFSERHGSFCACSPESGFGNFQDNHWRTAGCCRRDPVNLLSDGWVATKVIATRIHASSNSSQTSTKQTVRSLFPFRRLSVARFDSSRLTTSPQNMLIAGLITTLTGYFPFEILSSKLSKEGIKSVVHGSEPICFQLCWPKPCVSARGRQSWSGLVSFLSSPATVHDSVVDSKLTTFITENQNSDAATTLVESISEALQQVALVNDRKTLLDIASLGHSNNVAVIADVKDTVLLEHGSIHLLDNNRWGRRSTPRYNRSPMRMWWQGIETALLGPERPAERRGADMARTGGDAGGGDEVRGWGGGCGQQHGEVRHGKSDIGLRRRNIPYQTCVSWEGRRLEQR